MSSPFILGVTGGIGCGKTAVTNFFNTIGITIIDADKAARVVVEPSKPAMKAIIQRYGSDILKKDKTLNRSKLRDTIFTSLKEKKWLEELLHPLINQQLRRDLSSSKPPYTVLVSPLMLETGHIQLINRLLVVDLPEEVQLIRAMERDNMTEVQARRIIKSQKNRRELLRIADDVVDNSGTLTALHKQLKTLHKEYLKLAQERKLAHSQLSNS